MKLIEIQKHYHKFYKDIKFERIELFKCLNNNFSPKSVIYLGSSIHISPSFIFQNITYIDNSDFSKDFFSDIDELYKFISKNKIYKQKSFINYINNDYCSDSISKSYKYDIAISLFSLNTPNAMSNYIKQNGKIIFLPLTENKKYILSENLGYFGHISYSKGSYSFYKGLNNNSYRPSNKKFMKNNLYKEDNIYDVFIKK